MTETTPQIIVNVDPAFGSWLDREVTPEMVKGKFLWITTSVTRVRKELAAAERKALDAKYAHEDEFDRALVAQKSLGAKSDAEAERNTARVSTVRAAKRAKDDADLAVKALKDELDELYRSQMPATQSLNRIITEQYRAEWAEAGTQP